MVFKMAPDGKLAGSFSFSDYDERGGKALTAFRQLDWLMALMTTSMHNCAKSLWAEQEPFLE